MRNFIGAFFAVLITFSAANAIAEDDVYTSVVSADITDVNSSVARDKAMNDSNRKAFLDVVGKISTSDAVRRVSTLSDAQIINFIKEVAVVSEKASDVRYIAELKVTVNGALLRKYLKEQGIQFVEATSGNVVVVPVFREFKTDVPLLWETTNVWKKAWDENQNTSLVKIISIPTNGDNYAAVDAAKALSLNPEAMEKIAKINGVSDIYVADAVYDGIDGLYVNISSYQDGNVAFESIKVSGLRGDDKLFKDAIKAVSSVIADNIKKQSIQENSKQSEITVLYEMNNMREWVATEKQLKSIGYVKYIVTDALGVGKVQFKIDYVGTYEKLLQALKAKSFSLEKQGDFYLLRRI